MIFKNDREFRKYIKEHHVDELKDIVGKTIKHITSNDIVVFTDGTFIALDIIGGYDGYELEARSSNICLFDLIYMGISSQDEVRQMRDLFDTI